MLLLILGLFVFLAIHSLPMFPAKRASIIEKLGELPYKGLFSIISLAGFIAIIYGKGAAPFIAIWNPPAIFLMITKALMLPVFILLAAAYIPSNIKGKIKHPMLAGVKLWALAHLLSNGDLASILLFGSFLAYGVVDMISANKRMDQTAVAAKKPIFLDILVVVVGLAVYGAVAMHHMQLFGVPLF